MRGLSYEERYTAVAMPMLYNTRWNPKQRVVDDNHGLDAVLRHLMPAALRAKKNPDKRDEAICAIMNTSFILYSSIVSFYVPFIVTLLVYVQIYAMLRRRRKHVAAKRISVAMEHETQLPIKVERTLVREAIPYSEESEGSRFVGPPERSRPTGTPQAFQLGATSGSCLMAGKWKAPSSIEVSADPECDGQARFFKQTAFERCYIPPALYSACAWLGYVINPIIYTTFNMVFRKAFMKTLHC
ncbi:D(2) dopamine receptor-like [Cetorhinus maximus]